MLALRRSLLQGLGQDGAGIADALAAGRPGSGEDQPANERRTGDRQQLCDEATQRKPEQVQKRMRLLIERMTQAMTGAEAQKRKRAWVVLALMVGTITVARALPDGQERRELVAAALANALKTAKL